MDKFPECKDCLWGDDALPEVCDECDDGDQFEEADQDDLGDDSISTAIVDPDPDAPTPRRTFIPILEIA